MNPRTTVASLLALSLGCGGLFGFGAEVHREPVVSDQPFDFVVVNPTGEPLNAWFAVDLQARGAYGVTGSIQSDRGDAWTVNLGPEGAPVSGGRTTYMWRESTRNGNQSAQGNLFGFEVPPVAAGDSVRITGTLTCTAATTGSLELVITE